MYRRNVLSLGMLLTAGGLLPSVVGIAEAKNSNGLLINGAQGTWTGPAAPRALSRPMC